ncbi:MAG TPA: DUF4363 family protein [Clostridia bacterium]|jgi:hypothetical protein|nr:DUF4363 family protein [Clostridia bacterium]
MNIKLIVVILLVILLVGGGIWETIFVEKTLRTLDEKISAVMDAGEPYDPAVIEEIIKWWKGKKSTLALFLPHVSINEITFALHELWGTTLAEDYKSSTAVLTKVIGQIDSIEDTFTFSPANIL